MTSLYGKEFKESITQKEKHLRTSKSKRIAKKASNA
jgi:hypothetical protein